MENSRIPDEQHGPLAGVRIPDLTAVVLGPLATLRLPAPLLGEHTVDVLREAGYNEQEIRSLQERRVVSSPHD